MPYEMWDDRKDKVKDLLQKISSDWSYKTLNDRILQL